MTTQSGATHELILRCIQNARDDINYESSSEDSSQTSKGKNSIYDYMSLSRESEYNTDISSLSEQDTQSPFDS
jgi:hypothetical protein